MSGASPKTKTVRVRFRLRRVQADVVKRAAKLMGITPTAYFKLVAYRQALADLKAAHEDENAQHALHTHTGDEE